MKTRKLFSFLVVIVVLFGGFIFKPAPAKAIKNFTVEVTPRVCGEVAEYKFQVTIEKKLRVYEWIKFNFSKETKLIPPLPDEKEANIQRRKDIIENIYFCTSADRPHDNRQEGIYSMPLNGYLP